MKDLYGYKGTLVTTTLLIYLHYYQTLFHFITSFEWIAILFVIRMMVCVFTELTIMNMRIKFILISHKKIYPYILFSVIAIELYTAIIILYAMTRISGDIAMGLTYSLVLLLISWHSFYRIDVLLSEIIKEFNRLINEYVVSEDDRLKSDSK